MAALKAGSLGLGGVAAGTAVLAGGNALTGASLVNNTLFRDDRSLATAERSARTAGRVGSYGGAAIATGAAYGIVATAGSAAGITGTLAAVGGIVGGGMAAGAVLVVVGPAVIAAGVGGLCYGSYKLVSWLWD